MQSGGAGDQTAHLVTDRQPALPPEAQPRLQSCSLDLTWSRIS